MVLILGIISIQMKLNCIHSSKNIQEIQFRHDEGLNLDIINSSQKKI